MTPAAILCADWAKDANKRAVYVADVNRRTIDRATADQVHGRQSWSLHSVLDKAQTYLEHGPVLVTFDLPLGVPRAYLAALNRDRRDQASLATFLGVVGAATSIGQFYDECGSAAEWTVSRPFFAVPEGKGGFTRYVEAAAAVGVDLYRKIERKTGGKPVFVRSGLPGSAGSAATSLWPELARELKSDRMFKMWPFDGSLEGLLHDSQVVVGEIYPRAATRQHCRMEADRDTGRCGLQRRRDRSGARR